MDINKQKDTLLQLQQELATRAQRLDMHQRRETQDMAQDFADRATQTENDEVIDSLDQMTHARLEKIALALDRIEAGNYEECTICGEAIGDARLTLIPEANHCVACEGNIN